MNPQNVDPSPWYRHFWPWFIVILLGVSVVASLYTVMLAYQLGDIESPQSPSLSRFDPTPPGEAVETANPLER